MPFANSLANQDYQDINALRDVGGQVEGLTWIEQREPGLEVEGEMHADAALEARGATHSLGGGEGGEAIDE